MGYQRVLAANLACQDVSECASSVASGLVICTWSLDVQQWQICMALFHKIFRHMR